jgi:hypothetical protein
MTEVVIDQYESEKSPLKTVYPEIIIERVDVTPD